MFTIAYFSPTGNTLHLANQLKSGLGEDHTTLISMVTTNPIDLKKDQHLIIMYSVHAFNAPKQVKTYVKSIKEDLYDDISMIAVGCNLSWSNDASSSEIRNIFIGKGYNILVDDILAMPLTFIMNFPDELITEMITKSEASVVSISEAIKNGVKSDITIAFKSKLLTFVGRAEKHAAKLYGLELHANKNCISCGKCWESCPAGNISCGKKMKPKFGFKCMMCMKCIYDCPTHAISPWISKFMPIKGGYDINKYL